MASLLRCQAAHKLPGHGGRCHGGVGQVAPPVRQLLLNKAPDHVRILLGVYPHTAHIHRVLGRIRRIRLQGRIHPLPDSPLLLHSLMIFHASTPFSAIHCMHQGMDALLFRKNPIH